MKVKTEKREKTHRDDHGQHGAKTARWPKDHRLRQLILRIAEVMISLGQKLKKPRLPS